MQTAFAKYEGAGNDFILIDNREGGFTPRAELIAALCDRHFGIGADGLMTLARNAEIDCSMRYYNADGSEGEMCGNGARCFALFAEHRGIGGETKFFDAADGLHTARIRRLKGTSGEIELGMTAVREIRTGDGWREMYESGHGPGETGFTAHAFKGEEYKPEKSHRIDFIFYRGDVEVCDAEIVRDRKGAMYPSDHYFLFSEFTLR